MTENQRSILWATASRESLLSELARLRRRVSEAVESGRCHEAVTWRQWTEEILLELDLRNHSGDSADPPLTAV